MKSLLDIQKDVRNLENDIAMISANIKQINDDIDELRNHDESIDFDYDEIRKLSRIIPFKKHPISRIDDTDIAQLYLEILLNIIKFDDKNEDDKIDTRLVFIQWLLENSKTNMSLEELIVNSLRVKNDDFDKIAAQLNKKYKEHLVVDLLIVANMNGVFNEEECDYVVNMLTILGVESTKLKTLALIAKMVLCQKTFEFDCSLGNDLIKELRSYRHYALTNINDSVSSTDMIEEVIKSMRTIVVKVHSEDAISFKWKYKQHEQVTRGVVVATYQEQRKRKGYSVTKEIISPADGTLFQFRDNNVIYGVISHESDSKDSIKQWIKSSREI